MCRLQVQGKTPSELLDRLRQVLLRLRQHNLHVNRGKCQFFKSSITYLGHVIDKDGLYASGEKISAIVNSLPPTNVSQLHTFLGMVNYYQRFIPNLQDKLHMLHQLLSKNTRFLWDKRYD